MVLPPPPPENQQNQRYQPVYRYPMSGPSRPLTTTPKPTRAFSLVELSIVLVILGLLIGGILSGQSLIRAAELRSVSSDFSRYQTAAFTFRDKYFALPGDMTNATAFWNAADADPTTCKTTSSSTPLTCNGNGNGKIGDYYTGAERYEMHRFWQHLANAGLIEGTYNGVSADGLTSGVLTSLGNNAPAGKAHNTGWSVSNLANYGGDGGWFAVDYANYLVMGTQSAEYTQGKAFKPEEAWNIDTKIDDGKPAQGKVVAIHWSTCTDASANNTLTAQYALANSATDCAFAFIRAF